MMRKRTLAFFTVISLTTTTAWSATRDAILTNTTDYNYNYMYPYMTNKMRTNLNPGVTNSHSQNPINTVVRTSNLGTPRRVVPRKSYGTNRASVSHNTAAIPTPTHHSIPKSNDSRRVVARSGTQTKKMQPIRADKSFTQRTATNAAMNTPESDSARVSSVRCLTDYTECMNDYCERENTAYNRCYCSSKLAQIDSLYQPKINNLINKILTIKQHNYWTEDEMNEYWMNAIGKYRGENSWTNLDNALNIDWANTESRVRGQNAFTTGHEYCIQHLRGCSYMTSNLRDAYRSEIIRDCNTYEQRLQDIQNVAESIIGTYQ